MKRYCFLVGVLLCVITAVTAQIPPALQSRLQNKNRFADVMREVEDYYKDKFRGKGSGYKQWKRWEWFYATRTLPDGSIPNLAKQETEALRTYQQQRLGQRTQSIGGAWSPIGPTGFTQGAQAYITGLGRVDRIAFHPTDPNTFFIGTPAGGLWKTSNGGAGWVALSDELPSMGVSGIVCSYNNSNVLYVLTGDGDSNIGGFVEGYGYLRWSSGVFKSVDGGITWAETGPMFSNAAVADVGFKLIQHPTLPDVLYAATSEGIMATTNGGSTWTNIRAGSYTDIEFRPGDATILYAATRNPGAFELLRLTTFTTATPFTANVTGIPQASRMALAVTPASNNKIVVLCGPSESVGGSDGFRGLYTGTFSVNGSGQPQVSFTTTKRTPNILGGSSDGNDSGDQSVYDLCVAIKPTNSLTLVTGGLCVWRSNTGGGAMVASTEYFADGATALPYIHPDVHSVEYNPLNNKLYATTDGGVYVSNDDGVTWTDLSAGLQIAQYYHLTGINGNNNFLLGGLQDNGTYLRESSNATYKHIRGADGFDGMLNYNNPQNFFLVENTNVTGTTNGGATVFNATPPITDPNFFPELEIHPTTPATIYVGYTQGLYRNTAGGASGSWTYLGTTHNQRGLGTSPASPNRLYATSANGFFMRTNDATATTVSWTNLTNNPGFPGARAGAITDIAVHPGNADIVAISIGGFWAGQKFYYSTDAGATWQNLSGTLPNLPVNCVAINSNGDVYVGTDVGVFFQAAANSDWEPFYNNLPRVPVTELVINNSLNKIRAATFGRGIWESDLYTVCSPSMTLNGAYLGQQAFQAGNNINSAGTVIGSAGTKVFFKAGNYISLTPGFVAGQNTFFDASIGNCGPGVPSGRVDTLKTRQ